MLAPWGQVEKFPTVLGSQITLATIASYLRLATTGYRREFVDLLDELLERDPSTYAALAQRVLTVAGARLDLTPAELPPGDKRTQRAQEICDDTRRRLAGIADLRASLAELAWAIYYGPTGAEIAWDRRADGWHPTRLHFLHSRRIAYPDPMSWAVHVWDAGAITGAERTAGAVGLRVEDYPGKFVVHVPHVRADYPTRDGLGRQLVYWMALKGMAARSATAYLERFGKPWATASFTTSSTGQPQQATPDDVTKAQQAVVGLGAGTLSGATLPDSVKLELLAATGSVGLTHDEFLKLCDDQITRCVRGSTFTTSPGKFGAKGTAETARKGEQEIARFDAGNLAQTLKRDLVVWVVALNHPGEEDLTPQVALRVDEEPKPLDLLVQAEKAVTIGMPVDADHLAERTGQKLVPAPDNQPRVCVLATARAPQAPTVADPDPAPTPTSPSEDKGDDGDEDDNPTDDEDDDTPAPPSGRDG